MLELVCCLYFIFLLQPELKHRPFPISAVGSLVHLEGAQAIVYSIEQQCPLLSALLGCLVIAVVSAEEVHTLPPSPRPHHWSVYVTDVSRDVEPANVPFYIVCEKENQI